MKMKFKYIIGCALVFSSLLSCQKNYLDVVPDNVATIDNAFTLRNEAERYLFTCYSYLPNGGDPTRNPAFLAGDECWVIYPTRDFNDDAFSIARGQQNKGEPLMNFWDGSQNGVKLFEGLRTCNIFIENVSDLNKVRDLDEFERRRWLGEAMFLKAYYHYYLLRMYGPIPLIDKNLPVSASPDEVKVKRQPFDNCVTYISDLLDSSAVRLPDVILNEATELGRVTRPVALSIKAKLLLMAASPLFNGNADYAAIKGNSGEALFNATYSDKKWEKAAVATKEAITASESASRRLCNFQFSIFPVSNTTKVQMSVRNSVCEKWNTELIWGNSIGSTAFLQKVSMAHIDPAKDANYSATSQLSATMRMAELFYSKNGVPIDEDKTLDFSNKSALTMSKTTDADYNEFDRYNLITNYPTARLNFDREPRFYADLGFDGGKWYMNNSPSKSDLNTWELKAKLGDYGSEKATGWASETGYFIKKLVSPKWEFVGASGNSTERYPWPEIRLADLYLMYAEASNEFEGPTTQAFDYLNLVRARAGLKTIQESWDLYSNNPTKYTTKTGFRNIIKQERGIELAFEGSRYWDLLRWKDAASKLNGNIRGWNRTESTAANYYIERVIFPQTFVTPRDYLWPIKESNLRVNPNLVQNPGW